MADLGSIFGASPLDSDDGSYLNHTQDIDADQQTNALDNMPGDFTSMDTVTWHVVYSLQAARAGSGPDTYGCAVRIMSGATVLAAADSGGTYATINANVTSTTDSTGSVAFAYVNTGADKISVGRSRMAVPPELHQGQGPRPFRRPL